MKHKRGSVFILLGVLLLTAALGLTAWNLYEGYRAEKTSSVVVEQLHTVLPDAPVQPADPTPSSSGEVEIPDYVLAPDMEMPTVTVDGRKYIGTLQLPTLGLEFPIISRWSYDALLESPCRYTGSAYSGDMVLAAHNYNSHFGQLKNLHEGDSVIFTDVDGNTFTYAVATKETLMPTAVEEMTSGEFPLTLFTCTLGGSYRVTIRCEQVENN